MDEKNIPEHIAIIMDGNRRWAKERGLNSLEGHRAGAESFKKVAQKCHDFGVKILTIYAFSTENWKRSKEEIDYLMGLLEEFLQKQDNENFFVKNKARFNVIGQTERMPESLKNLIKDLMEKTAHFKERVLNMALSYGGRQEILDAVKGIIKDKLNPEKITEELFGQYLYTAGQQDPSLLIRTSGEQRLSGFLPWQTIYSELYFSPKYWPDFNEKDLEEAIKEYQKRQRRFGG